IFEGSLSRLALSRNIEKRRVGISNEELFPGLMIFPTHLAGFFEPQSSALSAGNTRRLIDLSKISLERLQVVVMFICSAGNLRNTGSAAPQWRNKKRGAGKNCPEVPHELC